jgi:hypothetical protein
MHLRDGKKERVFVKVIALSRILQFIGKYVQQDFRVTRGIDVSAVMLIKLFLELGSIGQIPVVSQNDTVRRIHIKGLRLRIARSISLSRVTNLSDANFSNESTHIACPEYIPDQSHALMHVKSSSVKRTDPG